MVLRPSLLIYGSDNKSKSMTRVKLERFEYGFAVLWSNARTWHYRVIEQRNSHTCMAFFWELLSRG